METTDVFGAPAYKLQHDLVSLSITAVGGMVAPVDFVLPDGGVVSPYYVSPWQGEELQLPVPVLRYLRGDFFCMPFGADSRFERLGDGGASVTEMHQVHGETATQEWRFVGAKHTEEAASVTLEMDTKVRAAHVQKTVSLRAHQTAIYVEHRISGAEGPMTLGHHATLGAQQPMRISTSKFDLGLTAPGPDVPTDEAGEYYALAPSAEFSTLSAVPSRWKRPDTVDCSVFPARAGFVDILSLSVRPGRLSTPAWTAAVCEEGNYLWYSLKDSTVLPTTVMWMENRGRHGAPWSGRNCCIGLEEVCGYLAEGLAASAADNPVAERGIPTVHTLTRERDLVVRNLQGVVPVPDGFGAVESVEFAPDGVVFVGEKGARVQTAVEWGFVYAPDAPGVA